MSRSGAVAVAGRQTMRGSINYQVNQVFVQSGIFRPGESKHEAKIEAREAGAKTWAEVGQRLDIYSYGTAQTYKDTWHEAARWCKAALGVRDIEKISGEHIKAYLDHRIEAGVAGATFAREAAALSKFERVLNLYAERTGSEREYDFRTSIQEARATARGELDWSQQQRAYTNPGQLIERIERPESALVARIQYESGARISEANRITSDKLAGLARDPVTGKDVGVIRLSGSDTKGGKGRDLQVSPATYRTLEQYIKMQGELAINKDHYRADLRVAAERSEQSYTGSHGLRWNFAQERVAVIQQAGYTYDQALAQTSWDMGHERPDITEHYLGK